jgi:hypothetical protein
MEKVIQVDTGYFCAGIVVENGICIDAAPILRWAIGKREQDIKSWSRIKRWTECMPS